jgi:hypothetical protein
LNILDVLRGFILNWESQEMRLEKHHMDILLSFSKSDECTKSCLDISANFIEFKEEIGILFLCDSLGKTDIRINSETDDEIALQDPFIKQILEERKLNPSLIAAIKQLPVNIAIVKRYLEIL